VKIGLLGIHEEYWPFLTTLIKEFGHEPILGKTNKNVIKIGTKYAENEQCVAIKIAMGQAISLASNIDKLLIPEIISVLDRTWTCPKWLGLYDMIKITMECNNIFDPEKILHPIANCNPDIGFVKAIKRVINPDLAASIAKIKRSGLTSLQIMGIQLGTELGFSKINSLLKVIEAQKKQDNYWIETAQKQIKKDPKNITFGIIGHPYLIHDNYLNLDLIKKLESFTQYKKLGNNKKEKVWGIDVITPDSVPDHIWKKYANAYNERKYIFWNTHRKFLGTLLYWLDNKMVDGIIFLSGVLCGEDALIEPIQDYIANQTEDIFFTRLVIDEHAGEAGLITRLEASSDTLAQNLTEAKQEVVLEKLLPKTPVIPKNLIVSCPNLGYASIAVSVFCNKLGIEFVEASPTTEKSTSKARRYCPEYSCRPFGVTLGNMLETLENRPDVNIFLQGGGSGPCKYGNYHDAQQIILNNCGHNIRVLPVRPPSEAGVKRFFEGLSILDPKNRKYIGSAEIKEMTRRFFHPGEMPNPYKNQKNETLWLLIKQGFFTLRGLDMLYKESLAIKPFEIEIGSTERALKEAQELFLELGKARINEIPEVIKEAFRTLRNIPAKINLNNPEEIKQAIDKLPKIGIVGEFYEVLSPESNFDIANFFAKEDKITGKKSAYVERLIHGSDWLDPFRKNIVEGTPRKKIIKLAEPYLAFCGGDGQDTIGHIIHCWKKEFDGIIAIRPWGCMPETVAAQIIPYLPKYGINIPVLIVTYDQQATNSANLITRLEAFCDQIELSRKTKTTKRELVLR